ncbi:MAG TPA: FAD-dependent oxidoreductase [Steroidobacteraceae bacterium]|nr:FAD-dependent oxidoreductase [Steroidobacteraceae bacterium]
MSDATATSPALPARARVVIIGGGVIGCSIAYHLAKLGWRDVVLLERKQLTSGTTWHAAGLLTTLRDTETQTRLAKYTQDLYRTLERETGQATGLIDCGSIQLAMTADKAEEMRRGFHMATGFGVEAHEISAAEVQKLWPLADVSDLEAAFYFPNDARVNPTDVTQALARGARQGGVRIFENTPVTGIRSAHGRVAGVCTAGGEIEAEVVVNCAGMWARAVGRMAGVNVPLQAAEHYYLISEPVAGVHPKLPILRDPGRCAYIREEAGKLMLGLFEREARPWGQDGIPADFSFGDIPPDWDRMYPHIERAMRRVPCLLETGIKLLFCGPESFTPDHNYLMGEAPNLRNFFVAAGFNSLGILSGGGVGRVMAQWIVDGHPPMDVWSVNLRRAHPWQDNDRFLLDRTVETLGIGYQDHWPFRQWQTARGVKKSILHDRLAAAGACFGESAGWERPNWYARPGQLAAYEYGWGRQNWFANNAEEHRAVRERVGLFEQSSFSKLLVQGRDAVTVLNRVATADVDVPVGRCVYTQFLNPRGGIEADLTVTRLGAERFLVLTAAFTQTHVEAWIRDQTPAEACCVVTDVSGAYAMLNVQGPASRALLASLSPDDFGNAAFPFATCREIRIGYQTALALRLTYVGELGWELYIPTPFALPVYDALLAAGAAHGLKHCGYHTLNSLRIEKAYRDWSHDVGPDDTPLEAGLAFTCAWGKTGGFVGREALIAAREAGPPRRRLVQFLLEDPEPLVYHNEPIYRDGERVGYVTSGMYGHTLGAAVALGYVGDARGVTPEFVSGGRFEIELAARRVRARASLAPLYDPKSARVRG